MGRLRRVLLLVQRRVCRQYRPSPSVVHKLHLPVVGEYGCAFSRIYHVTVWSAFLSFSFQMCSFSDVANDL